MQQAQMKTSLEAEVRAPRVANFRPLLIAGLRKHFADAPWKGTSELRQRFAPYRGEIRGQVGLTAYGRCFLEANDVEYLAGVEVSGSTGLPEDLAMVSIPAQRYLVFAHDEHVLKLHVTCDKIAEWLATSGCEARKPAGAPDFFERYSEEFNGSTGMGGMEVSVPIKG
jgi:AraC family transcriptional regulator